MSVFDDQTTQHLGPISFPLFLGVFPWMFSFMCGLLLCFFSPFPFSFYDIPSVLTHGTRHELRLNYLIRIVVHISVTIVRFPCDFLLDSRCV